MKNAEEIKDLEDAIISLIHAVRDNTDALMYLADKLPATAAAPVPEAPTIEAVQTALVAVSQKIGRDKAAEILLALGANKLPDLKTERYAEAVAHAEAMLRAAV